MNTEAKEIADACLGVEGAKASLITKQGWEMVSILNKSTPRSSVCIWVAGKLYPVADPYEVRKGNDRFLVIKALEDGKQVV